jgi:hypothetical protein
MGDGCVSSVKARGTSVLFRLNTPETLDVSMRAPSLRCLIVVHSVVTQTSLQGCAACASATR